MRASVNPERLQKYAANTVIWLFVRDPQKLDEIEKEDLTAFCQASAPLKTAYDEARKIFCRWFTNAKAIG